MDTSLVRKRIMIGGAVIFAVVVAAVVALALSTWDEVNRVTIERPEAPGADGGPTAAGETPTGPQVNADDQPTEDNHSLDVVLLVGSDSRDALDDLTGFGEFDGHRADVVIVMFRTGSETAVLSLPRDLWVDDPCSGGQARLNLMLGGCSDELNGPSLLTVAVENLIGQTIDHFVMVDLAGFEDAVDAIGGYQICLEYPVRDSRANLELPGGCTLASGEQTLAWMRSRQTEQLTETGWQILPGVNDLARNSRQRGFLIDMLSQLSDFSSPQAIASTAQAVAPFVTVDSQLTLVDAVDLAWAMRGMGNGSVRELDVPVYDFITDAGASVLLASIPISEIVAAFVIPEIATDIGLTLTG